MTNIFLRIRKKYLTAHIWNIKILSFKAVIFKRAYGIVASRPTPAPMEMHINLLSTSMWGIKTLQLSLNFPGRLVTVAKIPAQTSSLSLSFQGKFSDYCKNPRLNNLITPGFRGRKQTLFILPKTSSSLSSPERFDTFCLLHPSCWTNNDPSEGCGGFVLFGCWEESMSGQEKAIFDLAVEIHFC